jgi:hypothetical protein
LQINLPDPATEAQRLLADPEHLRRKAAYLREVASSGSAAARPIRLARAAELEAQADRLEDR